MTPAAKVSPAPPDYLDSLAQFACDTELSDLPASVIEHCKLMLADTIAVIGAGMKQPQMQSLVARQLPLAAPGKASVIGSGRRANALDAAMLNAIAGVWLELDEGHSYTNGHPGIHVIPAALAHAQENGVAGRDLLLAIVLGYEVCGRIGSAYKMRVIVQTHGTFGVIGAAVAVGRMSGLSRNEMREAINMAASTPLGGNRQTMLEGSTVRNYYPGHGNFTGQMVVRLVQSGFTAPRDAPAVTFGQILADDFQPEKARADLGTRWLIAGNYIKLYPSARYIHGAIDALFDALAKAPGGKVGAHVVDRVTVQGSRMLVFCGEKRPQNMFATQFSTPFSIATILYHGRADLDVFGEQAFATPAVLELASRVDMIEMTDSDRESAKDASVLLKIFLKDGSVYAGTCRVPRGEQQNAHAPADIERKYYQLAIPLWGDELARRVHESCMALDTLATLDAFAGGADL